MEAWLILQTDQPSGGWFSSAWKAVLWMSLLIGNQAISVKLFPSILNSAALYKMTIIFGDLPCKGVLFKCQRILFHICFKSLRRKGWFCWHFFPWSMRIAIEPQLLTYSDVVKKIKWIVLVFIWRFWNFSKVKLWNVFSIVLLIVPSIVSLYIVIQEFNLIRE